MNEEATLRAWWAHKQGLDGSLAGATPAEVFERTGWARSVGGAAPYLTLFSRAGIHRVDADKALEQREIHELPCARGCTYVVGKADFALALAAGQPFAGDEMKVAAKLGVTEAEIEKLRRLIAEALQEGARTPDEIRTKAGAAARSLGPEGVKKGLSTTLPVALGLMQSSGEIRRVPVNGRIDQQKYRYALWEPGRKPGPLGKWKKTMDETFAALAHRFFEWMGPATVKEFQEFAGLGVKAAKAAVEPLQLIGVGEERMLLPEDEAAYRGFRAPAKPQYALTSGIDNLRMPAGEESKSFAESHRIYDRGRLVGRWEFDPETASIAWVSFGPRDKALEEAVRKTETFIREDLGDMRGFSLDSPKSRAPRIAALRKAAAR
jgi:hypothetical protein